jgi:hypothetical protein
VDNKMPTSISVVSAIPTVTGQPTMLSAYVSSNTVDSGPTMTGTVTFSDGTTALPGTATLESIQPGYLSAKLSYTFTTVGAHNITAQFSGDSNYAASQSASTPFTFVGSVAVAINPTSVTVGSSGGTNTTSIGVYNNASTAETITLVCTPDSNAASCSFSSNSVNVAANSAQPVTLTYAVPALSGQLQRHSRPWSTGGGLMLAGVFAGAWLGVRRRRHLIVAILAAALAMALVSCGGGGGSSSGGGGPTSATYHFTITATSGSNTASQVLTVTVD